MSSHESPEHGLHCIHSLALTCAVVGGWEGVKDVVFERLPLVFSLLSQLPIQLQRNSHRATSAKLSSSPLRERERKKEREKKGWEEVRERGRRRGGRGERREGERERERGRERERER